MDPQPNTAADAARRRNRSPDPMNFRMTAVLFGTILVLGLVLLGFILYDESVAPPDTLVPPEFKADQIDSVEIERSEPAGKMKFARVEKDKWKIVEPVDARADSFAVSGAIGALLKAKPIAHNELTSNPASHGLQPPGVKVILRQGDKAFTVNIGNLTMGSSGVAFVTTSAQSRPMAVSRSDLDPLFNGANKGAKSNEVVKWTGDYRNKQVFTASSAAAGEDVASVKLTGKGKTLALNKTPDGWKFESPAGWGDADASGDVASTGITGVRPLVGTLTGMQATSADDFVENPKDLKEYGLNRDNPDLIRVELKPKDGPPEVVYIGKKVDAAPPPAAMPGMPPPAGKVYVQQEGSNAVMKVSVTNLDGLAAVINDPSPLRDRTLLAVDRSKIVGIDLTAGGQQTKLRFSGAIPTWQLYGGPNDPQPAARQNIDKMLDVLTERRTIKDFPAPNDANFTGPAVPNPVELKLWVEGFEDPPKGPDGKTDPKAEPKPKGVPITIQIGRQEGDSVFVRRILANGTRNDFLLPTKVKSSAGVETEVVASLAKTRLDLLDPTMKSFSTFNVASVTITSGGVVTQVNFDEKADPPYFPTGKWTFAQPEPQKGRIADAGTLTDLLTLLSTQQAVRFISEAPTDPQLAGWGLGPNPRVKVVVGLKPPPPPPAGSPPTPPDQIDKERVWEFGNETDDKNHVYARQAGRAAVFTVPKHVFEKFATPDLRDKTVLRFDVAKVKLIRVRGWKAAVGTPQLLEFEKKGSDWAVRTPAGYNLDPTKVNSFLGLLNGLRAKAFLPGPVKPEHHFPPEEEGLEVTLEREDGPPISLNIAALNPADGNNSYFVWCGALPPNEQVFTVLNDPFKPFKEKPAAFSK